MQTHFEKSSIEKMENARYISPKYFLINMRLFENANAFSNSLN
jgi:hypothetical protein